MNDFLHNIRKNTRFEKNSRTYNGNKRNGRSMQDPITEILSETLPAVKKIMELDLEVLNRLAAASERRAMAEERTADALFNLAVILAKLSGQDIELPPQKQKTNDIERLKQPVKPVTLPDEPIKKHINSRSENIEFPPDDIMPASQSRGKIMETITSLRNKGMSYGQIATHMQKEKIPTLSGRGKWHASTIANIMK